MPNGDRAVPASPLARLGANRKPVEFRGATTSTTPALLELDEELYNRSAGSGDFGREIGTGTDSLGTPTKLAIAAESDVLASCVR